MNMIDVFISHSHNDKVLAEAVTQLLRDTVDLNGGKIRCTSTYGADLAIGSKFAKQLRRDIKASEVILAILSVSSIASQFCMVELGAAWGLKKPIKPLLAPGFDGLAFRHPFSDLHFLHWNSETDWIKLLEEIAELTDGDLEESVIIHGKIRDFCARKL